MVKVKDTESFIRRAREIHGDRYDYQETVYAGSSKPVTIICRECGPFRLSQAGSHTNPGKACGCRSCGIEQSLESRGRSVKCVDCGERCKYAVSKKCKQCRDKTKESKVRNRQELLSRRCKVCGKSLESTDKRKTCCSSACGFIAMRKPRVTVKCCVCGNSKEVYKSQVKERHCCSNRCQKRFAAHGGRKETIAKRRLPVLYACDTCGSLKRRFDSKCLCCAPWIQRLATVSKESQLRYRERDWYEILRDLANYNAKRRTGDNNITLSHEEVICHETEKQWLRSLELVSKHSTCSMSWREKLSNMAGNHRQRMYRKSLVKR